jgi:hypothetical protein
MNQRNHTTSTVKRGIFYASRTLNAPRRENRPPVNRLRRGKSLVQAVPMVQQSPQPTVELSQAAINRLLHTPLKDLTEQEIQSARDLWRKHSKWRQSFRSDFKKHSED